MKIIKELYKHFLGSDGVSTDSREDVTDCIFFALSGENFNGNKFVSDAIKKGAALCVIDDPFFNTNEKCLLVTDVLIALQALATYHRKQCSAKVLAITGSNGKTTTKELISSVLSSSHNIISTNGNFNNHIGVPLTLLRIVHDTEIAVVEMGANHGGEITKLCEIATPDIGLITNIGHAHLEGFGSFEGVIAAKNELYQYILSNKGTILLNSDDKLLSKLSNGIKKFTYGTENADVKGKIIKYKPFVNILWNFNESTIECHSRLYGRYNFFNLMAAIATGLFFCVPLRNINKAIESYVPENSRSQQLKTKTNSVVLDAYNANPTSMKEAIISFAESKFDNPWLILGDMFELGNYSSYEHQKIIDEIISNDFTNVILIGEYFYNTSNHNFLKFKTTNEASGYLNKNKLEGANILIKGSRGMKLEKTLEIL